VPWSCRRVAMVVIVAHPGEDGRVECRRLP
jgi:hypothetical protein